MGRIPEAHKQSVHENRLNSDIAARFRRFKRGVVLDLFMKRGQVWSVIHAVRKRWDIESINRLPRKEPSEPFIVSPPQARAYEGGHPDREWIKELQYVCAQIVPEEFLARTADNDWRGFFSVCLFFDPPERDLLTFAEYGGPEPKVLKCVNSLPRQPHMLATRYENTPWSELPHTVAPPVKVVRYESYEPEDLPTHVRLMLNDLFSPGPLAPLPPQPKTRYFIEVSEGTTEADVRSAFRMLTGARREGPQRGAPERDQLVSLQCAILYDRHNHEDPTDGRRRTWTYKRLAKEFGLRSARAARQYVGEGRKVLKNFPMQ